MSEQQQNPQAADVALQYLAEVANTYAQTLAPVAKAPFVQHVNNCLRVLKEERDRLLAELQSAVVDDTPEPVVQE